MPTLCGAAAELQAAAFFSPGPAGLLRLWQFAGPACCHKAAGLARGAGPGSGCGSCGSKGPRATCEWEDWWPSLARCSLTALLHAPPGSELWNLDQAWAAIRARPEAVNASTPEGKRLVLAIRRGCRYIAELLRHSGAVLSGRVADELLYEAAGHGNAPAVKLLLCDGRGAIRANPWASANAKPMRHGGTPLDAATSRGHGECAEVLRRAGGRHSLHNAAVRGLLDDVTAWLADGACVDEPDGKGATPLWLAVQGACGPGSAKVEEHGEQRERCVRMLLEAGATVDALPITLETPLLVAAAHGHARLCSLLMRARADPTVRDRSGRTALSSAEQADVQVILSGAPVQAPCLHSNEASLTFSMAAAPTTCSQRSPLGGYPHAAVAERHVQGGRHGMQHDCLTSSWQRGYTQPEYRYPENPWQVQSGMWQSGWPGRAQGAYWL
uniref:Uncharacterized protein n=1 Tax=Alexandrium monilatum TaxID=311494 RepID=A0A7S4S8B8_9DINO